jgi:hypothetical protein
MKKFDEFPKAFKKMVRYINQEATMEQIGEMEIIFIKTVALRLQKLQHAGNEQNTRNESIS